MSINVYSFKNDHKNYLAYIAGIDGIYVLDQNIKIPNIIPCNKIFLKKQKIIYGVLFLLEFGVAALP